MFGDNNEVKNRILDLELRVEAQLITTATNTIWEKNLAVELFFSCGKTTTAPSTD